MQSNSSRKASKGSVQVKSSHGRLQLVFSHAGKRHYLSLGVPDTKNHRKVADIKAGQIELDILSGNFDATLEKYKPETALSTVTPISTPIPPKVFLTPLTLWEKYSAYKASGLKETTQLYNLSFARLFERIGEIALLDALRVKAALEQETTVYQTKRALSQLSTACDWAKKHGLVDSNPYEGMANEMPKYRYQLEPKPNAFSEEERSQVLEAFRTDERRGMNYQHYTPFVEFLFLTGCRPSEAIGLQWKHVAEDFNFVYFQGSITTSGNGRPIRVEGSKNNKKRRFTCSERLRELLRSRKPSNVNPNALVFPSPKGKTIIYNNFCTNAWTKVVDPIKPETTPYSCRDTFITLQILKGAPETAIAKWCDTSVEMIEKHYVDHLKLTSLRPAD